MTRLADVLRTLLNWIVWYTGLFVTNIFPNGSHRTGVVIVKTGAIGDFVLFMPALQYLKEKYADYELELVVQDRVADLAAESDSVTAVRTFNLKQYKRNPVYKFRFLWMLFKRGYAICVNPTYSRDRVGEEIALWTGAEQKIGWMTNLPNMKSKELKRGNKIYDQLFPLDNSGVSHELFMNKQFIEHLGFDSVHLIPPKLSDHPPSRALADVLREVEEQKRKLVTIIPGALDEFRQWGVERFAQLMMKIQNSVDYEIVFVIVGSEDDRKKSSLLVNAALGANVVDLTGKLTLPELPFLFRRSLAVIGNETGPIHIAACCGTNTVCISGGGHFERFVPYPDEFIQLGYRLTTVYHKMDCYYCGWHCIFDTPTHEPFPCVASVDVESVFMPILFLLHKECSNNE